MNTPYSQHLRSLRSIKELEYSLTLRTLYTNAANIVAINGYQFVWLLPAHVVSVISTNYGNHLLIIFLPRFDAWLFYFGIGHKRTSRKTGSPNSTRELDFFLSGALSFFFLYQSSTPVSTIFLIFFLEEGLTVNCDVGKRCYRRPLPI